MSPLEILLLSMAGLFLLGIPIFMALAASSCITLLCTDILPLSIIHNSLFDGLNIFPLLAVPSFVVAGTLMEYGNITDQIITVVKQIVGRSFGGLGICTILACTFFAAIAGSGTATTAAIGAILIPSMMKNSYKPGHAFKFDDHVCGSWQCIGDRTFHRRLHSRFYSGLLIMSYHIHHRQAQ